MESFTSFPHHFSIALTKHNPVQCSRKTKTVESKLNHTRIESDQFPYDQIPKGGKMTESFIFF